jgi:DNA-directed RNA polymerase subunit M/transcription elongation factor TFIIS
MSGEIPAARFVIMTHDELKSAERQKEDEKLEAENMKNSQVPMAERSISDALQCGKCKKKEVAYSQAQTRSADEPMTTFCECTFCGNRWKVQNPQFDARLIANLCTVLLNLRQAGRLFSSQFFTSLGIIYGWIGGYGLLSVTRGCVFFLWRIKNSVDFGRDFRSPSLHFALSINSWR